jgi:hypothetical protein
MTKEIKMNAKRVATQVPVYDLFADNFKIGTVTNFEGEGAVATIETIFSGSVTIKGEDFKDTLRLVRKEYLDDIEYAREEAKWEAFAEAGSSAIFAGASMEVAYQAANEATNV